MLFFLKAEDISWYYSTSWWLMDLQNSGDNMETKQAGGHTKNAEFARVHWASILKPKRKGIIFSLWRWFSYFPAFWNRFFFLLSTKNLLKLNACHTSPQKFSFKVMLCFLPFPFPYHHTDIHDTEVHFPHSNTFRLIRPTLQIHEVMTQDTKGENKT